MKGILEISVLTVDCITCAIVFRREFRKVEGVESVKELPLLNKIVIEFDQKKISEALLKEKVIEIGNKAGFRDKLMVRGKNSDSQETMKEVKLRRLP